MPYNENSANRIREALKGVKNLTEKKMFGGIAFMMNGKMCVGVDKDDMMLRCEPTMTDELLLKKGARRFDLTGRIMNGWLLVDQSGIKSKEEFDFWIQTSIKANKKLTTAGKRR